MEASSSHQARPANPPRTRQRAYKEPPQLDVPDIDQDAAERKRVLNVLAQRRYRKKALTPTENDMPCSDVGEQGPRSGRTVAQPQQRHRTSRMYVTRSQGVRAR
jgi:hypothetical protein